MKTVNLKWKQDDLKRDLNGADHFWLGKNEEAESEFEFDADIVEEHIEKIELDGKIKYAIIHLRSERVYDTFLEAMNTLEKLAANAVSNHLEDEDDEEKIDLKINRDIFQ
jgi:hypothetical protein